MKKTILLLSTLFTSNLFAQYNATISTITPDIKKRMVKGNSWQKECPVPLRNLRYLQMSYIDFNGQPQTGEMIVHKDVADVTVATFEDLYKVGYAIHKMHLISYYKGNDWKSIENDNTSAFNCRPVSGKKGVWSKHAYGKAIDINPIANPYVYKSGHISHKASYKYKRRRHQNINNLADRALLMPHDPATKIFKHYGWGWGGEWVTKDYQHFFKK
jgi:poly-gamma-glutamate synthesis protein (capsule biosynthesis protein)